MRPRFPQLCVLLLLPLILSGCSLAGVDLSFSTKTPAKATGMATAVPTQSAAEAVPTPAYDLQAGNCPDASNQAIALIELARGKGFNLDMQLRLSPRTVSCGQEGAALANYRARVADVELRVYVIDGTWAGFYAASRVSLVATLVDHLHALYPAAIARATVYEGDLTLGSVVLGQDNKQQINCCAAG